MTGVARFYGLILRGPWWILLCYALVIGVAVSQLPKLRLDASSDSLGSLLVDKDALVGSKLVPKSHWSVRSISFPC